jgi:hypothetical protein
MATWRRAKTATLDFHGGTILIDNYLDRYYVVTYQNLWTLTLTCNICYYWWCHCSHQHVNRTLSSVGGTVAAACAAWEEYARRYPNNVDKTMTNSMTMFQNENNMHLCWAGNYYTPSLNDVEWWNLQCWYVYIPSHLLTAAHVAGGTHHAFKDYGEGFCIFSGRVFRLFAICHWIPCSKVNFPCTTNLNNNFVTVNIFTTSVQILQSLRMCS